MKIEAYKMRIIYIIEVIIVAGFSIEFPTANDVVMDDKSDVCGIK